MKLATRLNSVLPTVGGDILQALEKISEIEGITSVDLNYPEHLKEYSVKEVSEKLNELGLEVNGIALRFRDHFKNGELGNRNKEIAKDAYDLCIDAIEACRQLGGKVITLWFGFDGFDYPFQTDYKRAWDQMKAYLVRIADYAPDLKISIEYKPYQERSFALIDSIGTTMLMVNEVDRENIGVTVDYCHMLMKRENPAYGLVLAADKNKLYGVHINDGYGQHDDGLMVGTVSLMQTLEFMYYLKKAKFDEAIYFDTFPVREEPIREIKQNVKTINLISKLIDSVGMDYIESVIDKNSAVEANHLFLKFLTSFNSADLEVKI